MVSGNKSVLIERLLSDLETSAENDDVDHENDLIIDNENGEADL